MPFVSWRKKTKKENKFIIHMSCRYAIHLKLNNPVCQLHFN